MNQEFQDAIATRPALPEPERNRWQPLRIGVLEMFHYDAEEFWFRNGHLLLRGNNGTGKSKLLSLTLPFLFDGYLHPSRIEPDGDSGKKMAWNLLMNAYERRIGYTWIEFGRLVDGQPVYLTLGAGLSAAASRNDVDSWFFILEDEHGGPRIGRDLWLTNPQKVVLTQERLREALEGKGQVFRSASAYRRAVDERLFRLGPKRYDALIDTLIQLRHPQLSKKPDEKGLSHALTEALPPMPQELLVDVAEALNQLEEDRRQLEDFQQLAEAVDRFNQRYRIYAGTLSRRQARELRQAQTDFDNAGRERNEAQLRLEQAQTQEIQAQDELQQIELSLAAHRTRLQTLMLDPTNKDAGNLDTAEQEAEKRHKSAQAAHTSWTEAATQLEREERNVQSCEKEAANAEASLARSRHECADYAGAVGLTADYAGHAFASLAPPELVAVTVKEMDAAQTGLRKMVAARREHLALLRRRHLELSQSEQALDLRREALRERQQEFDSAGARRAEADAAVERIGQELIDQWIKYCASLQQLRFDVEAPLDELSQWVVQCDGPNPMRQGLMEAQHRAGVAHAARQADLDRMLEQLRREQTELEFERQQLSEGRDTAPPLPYTRATNTRSDRAGAPFWQLIDFHDHVDSITRAGMEAALEASGLLDAWVTPDGALATMDNGTLWQDAQMISRPSAPSDSLASCLRAAVPSGVAIPENMIERLLGCVSCAENDPEDSEAWISPAGRFRLGTLTGAWSKPEAVYIGFAARAAARARRLAEIDLELKQLEDNHAEIKRNFEQLAADRSRAEQEWHDAPLDQSLAQAHLTAATREREFQDVRSKLSQAETLCHEAEEATQKLRGALERDAADLRLPMLADALPAIDAALENLNDALYRLVQAVMEWRRAWPALEQQRTRQAEAQAQVSRTGELLEISRTEAAQARAHFETLRGSIGAKVETLRQQIAEARREVDAGEDNQKAAGETFRKAGEARAVADEKAKRAEDVLAQRGQARAAAVARLQRFAESSLLSSALPEIELPDLKIEWTIDPALTLARRAEQALSGIKDDDATLERLQRQISDDLSELQRALGALGHRASAEPGAWGFVVQIVYQNRPERPDRLMARLNDEISQRSELLTAREREVLENHLQAEIATEIQHLLRSAEKHVNAINAELHKRPTSTGVRYRLQWLPLTENEGAPTGLEAARQRLLNTSADLWSAEDRSLVGKMLQQRITDERKLADTGTDRDAGLSLIDQLARALDYRHWHHFRVQRLQDGQWRKLSGPASSGERALGLTVPLFAAIASFYSQGSYVHAPRLMLLDEAFAGIDDAARAHCMGLIREFDLDFVITSEREWGCYAELPGVAICQLLRREGVDAIYVSRWTWDGRSKRREEDPNRRFETV
jgi:uncharacterized protein (TIGR02680 family)